MNQTYPMRCRVRAAADGAPARIDVFDDIGGGGLFSDGLSAKAFGEQLSALKGPLDVHVNSSGGDVADGIAIMNAIQNYPGKKRTVVDGLAASIASVIAQAGDERIVEPGSMMMIHDPLTFTGGNADEFRKTADTLDKHGDNLASIYARRAGGTPQQWRDVMKGEQWYTADEAVDAGLADRVGSSSAQLPAGLDVAALGVLPTRVMARLQSMPRAAADGAPVTEPDEGMKVCPLCKGARNIRDGHVTCPECKGKGQVPEDSGDGEGASDRGPRTIAADGDGTDGGQQCLTCGGKGRLPHPVTGKNSTKCPSCDGTGQYMPVSGPAEDVQPDVGDSAAIRPRAAAATGSPYEPEPYEREPWENVECPACAKFSDEDARFCGQCGTQLIGRPDVRVEAPPGTGKPDDSDGAQDALETRIAALERRFLAAADVDNSPWDGGKAMANGAAAGDPAAFYAGICAGEKSGDKSTQAAWALPYKYHPDDPPNAAGVKAALGALNGARGGVQGLTNEAEAKKTLQAAMKQVNPDWEPDDSTTTGISAADAVERFRAALPALKGVRA